MRILLRILLAPLISVGTLTLLTFVQPVHGPVLDFVWQLGSTIVSVVIALNVLGGRWATFTDPDTDYDPSEQLLLQRLHRLRRISRTALAVIAIWALVVAAISIFSGLI